MIGMNFWAFLVVTLASVVSGGVVHYVIRYRFLEGIDGFLGKVIVAWLGAWLGSPVIGHWFEPIKIAGIYLIPALLGALVGAFIVVGTWKALAKAIAPLVTPGSEVPGIRTGRAA